MAQEITVTLTDDLTGGPATVTRTVSLDGVTREIDLNDENAAKLDADFAQYIEHGRKPAQKRRGRKPGSVATAAGEPAVKVAPSETKEARQYLKDNAFPDVPTRGRLRPELLEAYRNGLTADQFAEQQAAPKADAA